VQVERENFASILSLDQHLLGELRQEKFKQTASSTAEELDPLQHCQQATV